MYTEERTKEICEKEILKEMGREYIDKHNGHICIAAGELDENTYMYFAGFKDENKDNEEFKGWTVYAYLEVDFKDGKIIKEKIGRPKHKE